MSIGKIIDINTKEAENLNKSMDDAFDRAAIESLAVVLIAVLLSIVMGVVLSRSITGPFNKGIEFCGELSKGHVSARLNMDRADEVGDLARAMDKFAGELQGVTGTLKAISEGDLSRDTQAADSLDEIRPALQAATVSLRAMSADALMLAKAAVEGKLDTRADAQRQKGEYRKIVQGVNDCLDAVLNPIKEAAQVLDQVAAKDMTARVKGDYQGDHAKIKVALNTAIQNLDEALGQTSQAAGQVASAAEQISSGAQSLSQGASEQASSLEEISSSLEEMAGMTRQNSENAKTAKNLAEGARNSAERGDSAMGRMIQSINDIKKASDDTAKIVKTIDEIAFQTNLLALNAAVEAARAGEAGKGFAVVAEEVRALAQRSAEAAKTTSNLIEGSVKSAEGGVNITQEVAKALSEIVVGAKKVNDLVAEIAAASDEQKNGIDQVNTGVGQLNQVTQQNAATAEESASASEELNAQAQAVEGLVGQFRISNSGLGRKTHTQGLPGTGGAHIAKVSMAKPPAKQLKRPEAVIPLAAEELASL